MVDKNKKIYKVNITNLEKKMAEYHQLKNKIDRASIKDRIKFLFWGKV